MYFGQESLEKTPSTECFFRFFLRFFFGWRGCSFDDFFFDLGYSYLVR